jgi:hypothetical protein
MTQFTVQLPEDIARGLEAKWKDLSRAALEAMAIEGYRARVLSAYQVRRMLGFQTRFQLDGFFKQHEVFDYTLEDLQSDRDTLRRLSSGGH